MKRLEQLTCICMIAVSLLAGYVLVEKRLDTTPARGQASIEALTGKRIALTGVQWDRAKMHIVIAMSTHCSFCEASLPFYRNLDDLSRRSGSGLSVEFVSAEPDETTRRFLNDNGVQAPVVLSARLKEFGVTGTPTIFLVDSHGVIQMGYVGKLNADNEALVIREVTSGLNSRG